MEQLCIDPVTRATLPELDLALTALSRDLGDTHRATTRGFEAALFGVTPSCHALLAREGQGQAIGAALFSPVMSTSLGTSGAYVSDLWVSDTMRGAGLGRQLLKAVAERAGHLWQAQFLRLVSYQDNLGALRFYDRLGFEAKDNETGLALTGVRFERLKEQSR